ncbi:hypothetical protein UFOVP250_75 [uncultured Caudovirales phage]|uniref:Uncharacterized protein n=1 Tax=uncultured Caudovirales phage TaxID=2100421 RepID=A0A6J5LF88_9CAUD|nr:hypothetical protein UFOVP250_75 [uncultured Caudovirales phage]
MNKFIDLMFFILFILVVFMATFSFISIVGQQQGEFKYDCRAAEISPDYPQEVKEECRRLMEKK